MTSISRSFQGVAIDAGSGLEASIRTARGSNASADDLLVFKRAVLTSLGPHASTVLVDAACGPALLSHYPPTCERMMAYEADVYHISDDDRVTVLPDNVHISDYPGLGINKLKFFLYYAPNDDPVLNQRKQDLVAGIGQACDEYGLEFLMEPLVYDRDFAPGDAAFAQRKPELVRRATEVFAGERFCASVLKVEVPVDLAFVEGFGEPLLSREQALEAFQVAGLAAGNTRLVYLSAGVSFDWFEASLKLAGEAGVPYAGFMCGRAIWSDAVDVFGKNGEAALHKWLGDTGKTRLLSLVAALG